MMKIEVYKCKYTGKLFELEDRADYLKHTRKAREKRKAEQELARIRKEFKDWFAAEKEKIVHVDMIVPWVMSNQKYLMKAWNSFQEAKNSIFRDDFYDTDEFTSMTMDFRYSDFVSNSHSCPRNGVQNWGGDKKLPDGSLAPTGYPGWSGNFESTLKRDKKHNSSYPTGAFMRWLDIQVGSGGGGNEHTGYDFKIFLADWPGLQVQVEDEERDRIVRKLKGIR